MTQTNKLSMHQVTEYFWKIFFSRILCRFLFVKHFVCAFWGSSQNWIFDNNNKFSTDCWFHLQTSERKKN